jgi:hypothetical protein
MSELKPQTECSRDSPLEDDSDRTMGPWSLEENIFYISFLEKNRGIMSSKKKRRYIQSYRR